MFYFNRQDVGSQDFVTLHLGTGLSPWSAVSSTTRSASTAATISAWFTVIPAGSAIITTTSIPAITSVSPVIIPEGRSFGIFRRPFFAITIKVLSSLIFLPLWLGQ